VAINKPVMLQFSGINKLHTSYHFAGKNTVKTE